MSEFDENKNELETEEVNKTEQISETAQEDSQASQPVKAEEKPEAPKPQNTPAQPPVPPQNGFNGQYRPPIYPRNGAPVPPPPKKTNYVYYGNPSVGNQTAPPSYNPMHSNDSGKKSGKNAFIIIIAIISVVAIALAAITLNGRSGASKKEEVTEKVNAPKLETSDVNSANVTVTQSAEGALDAVSIYNKVKDASVGILVYSSNTSRTAGEGSGVIIGEGDGGKFTYILTCAHVVSGGSIKVQLSDESQYSARVIGSDARTDIAVLRIEKTGLTKMEIGNSDKLTVGERIYAIGNPGGVEFAGSFTDGMVSAIARPINSEIGYEMVCIQHTAAINPGNSGGALVNQYGQLVGINSSKIASASYEGMGFAVPSTTIVKVYNEIIENGYVTNRPMLGINYAPVAASQSYSMLAGAAGLPSGSLIIQSISVDSSLNDLGVQKNDIITQINGKDLESYDTLSKLIEQSNVGDKIKLTICRFDTNSYQPKIFEVEATLVEDKGEGIVEQTTSQQFNPFGNYGFGN